VQVTVLPSPIAQTTLCTFAVAVTLYPADEAVRVIGPHVCRPGFATHIHVGSPTIPILPARASGTMPIPIARNRMVAIARNASTRGSGGAAEPAGEVADQNVYILVPTMAGE